MYKLSIPLSLLTLNEESLPIFLEEFRKAKVERIFLFGGGPFYQKDCALFTGQTRLAHFISYFQEKGFEVGVWMGAFGHGDIMVHAAQKEYFAEFTKIKGVDGKTVDEGFCPLDKKLQSRFCDAVRIVASMHPDIIMLDDDFRLNVRSYNMGCCCDKHLKQFYDAVGEEIPMEELEKRIFTGGKNKYRTAWLKVMGDSLLDFAKLLRNAVDEVDETIRMGSCAVYSTWDFDGTDMIAISKALAGKTRSFIRTIGAPYHGIRPQYVVEHTRMQAAWCKEEDIEIFSEGDVYPRPRYVAPAKFLELFDMALLTTNATEGILKYMYDFRFDVNYEMGYNARHVRNTWLREGITELFHDKEMVGVKVCETMRKVENFDLPMEYKPGVATFVQNTYFSIAGKLLSENAIPTVYEKNTGYPAIIFGENAKYISEEELKHGAILDVIAAKILQERGIDTGIVKSEPCDFVSEFFQAEEGGCASIAPVVKHKAECSPMAMAESFFMPGNAPASYRFENQKGQRFYVLLVDMYQSDANNHNYFLSYYRQKHLTDAIAWLCGKPLPAVCNKNPYLYMQAAKGKDGAMAVALFNMNFDEIIEPVITLDNHYNEIKCLNCKGTLCENKVTLEGEIAPYGVAIFEVK